MKYIGLKINLANAEKKFSGVMGLREKPVIRWTLNGMQLSRIHLLKPFRPLPGQRPRVLCLQTNSPDM